MAAGLKAVVGIAIAGFYWFWVNQRLISGDEAAFGFITLFFLISCATSFFPLPSNLILLGAVQTIPPFSAAVIAGFATIVAYGLEYIFFTQLFRLNKVGKVKETWIYEKVKPLFKSHKFLILSVTSFLPIPSEALRVYSITEKYSPTLYMLSGFTGRLPRYLLLGYFGKDYAQSLWFIVAVFVVPVILVLMMRGAYALVEALRAKMKPDSGKNV